MDTAHNLADVLKEDFLVALCNGIKEGAAIIEKISGKIIFCYFALREVFDADRASFLSWCHGNVFGIKKLTDKQLI